jgi:hypothetical protein
MLKTENKHTLNYFSVCSKKNNFLWYLRSPTLTACFQCLLLRGKGSKQKCLVRAAFKYQYQELSPFRFAHPFHFALPSPKKNGENVFLPASEAVESRILESNNKRTKAINRNTS